MLKNLLVLIFFGSYVIAMEASPNLHEAPAENITNQSSQIDNEASTPKKTVPETKMKSETLSEKGLYTQITLDHSFSLNPLLEAGNLLGICLQWRQSPWLSFYLRFENGLYTMQPVTLVASSVLTSIITR